MNLNPGYIAWTEDGEFVAPYNRLQRAAAYFAREGNSEMANAIDDEIKGRQSAARDRWAEEAAAQREAKADRSKYGTFYANERRAY